MHVLCYLGTYRNLHWEIHMNVINELLSPEKAVLAHVLLVSCWSSHHVFLLSTYLREFSGFTKWLLDTLLFLITLMWYTLLDKVSKFCLHIFLCLRSLIRKMLLFTGFLAVLFHRESEQHH